MTSTVFGILKKPCPRVLLREQERATLSSRAIGCLLMCHLMHLEGVLRVIAWGRCWQLWLPLKQTVISHRCLADLRNAGDLSLRHASAQALARFVEAARSAHAAPAALKDDHQAAAVSAAELLGLPLVLHRVMMPQIKLGSADANLAVRQVRCP